MKLYYFDNKSSGPVVLFIHGTASANEIWKEQYEILDNSNFRIIGIDLRGHGNSVNPGGVCSEDDHVSDLKETLDSLSIDMPITIIGHSFGAVLAIKFAEQYPELVNKLLLVSMPAKVPKLLQWFYKWLLGKPIEFLKSKTILASKIPLRKRFLLALKSDLNIVRQIWTDSLKWDFLTSIPSVSCPVYLSVGRFDYVALNSMVKKLHLELPGSSYKVFNWSSHTCMDDEPHEFNKWILSVLALPFV